MKSVLTNIRHKRNYTILKFVPDDWVFQEIFMNQIRGMRISIIHGVANEIR